jgi:Ca2+/Na+ antiporter
MGSIKKEIFIGFLIGLIAWSFGFYLYVEFSTKYSFVTTLEMMREGDLIGKVMGLVALPNLAVFFIFLKKKQEYRARGVVFASFFITFLILLAQFI